VDASGTTPAESFPRLVRLSAVRPQGGTRFERFPARLRRRYQASIGSTSPQLTDGPGLDSDPGWVTEWVFAGRWVGHSTVSRLSAHGGRFRGTVRVESGRINPYMRAAETVAR